MVFERPAVVLYKLHQTAWLLKIQPSKPGFDSQSPEEAHGRHGKCDDVFIRKFGAFAVQKIILCCDMFLASS